MITILNIFTIINLMLLGGILFFKKKNSLSSKVLGLIIFIPATTFVTNYFLYSEILFKYPILLFLGTNFLWAPFVLWYVLLMLGEDIKPTIKNSIHVLPFVFYFICEIILFVQPNEYRQKFLFGIFHGNYPWQLMVLNGLLMIQTISYLTYSYVRIRRYTIGYEKSGITEDNMVAKVKWVKIFIRLLIALNIVAIILGSLLPMEETAYVYCPLIYDVAFYLVIAGAIRNSTLFSETGFKNYLKAEKENKEKYLNSSITPSQMDEYCLKFTKHFQDNKPYLSATLTIKHLSDELLIPQHNLSQLINQKFNKNFFDLINYNRVEEAKARIKNIGNSNLTVEGIGMECGFGSPSAFYRAFKKNTGFTPSQYLKQL